MTAVRDTPPRYYLRARCSPPAAILALSRARNSTIRAIESRQRPADDNQHYENTALLTALYRGDTATYLPLRGCSGPIRGDRQHGLWARPTSGNVDAQWRCARH